MKETAELLKSTRMSKGLSLEEISSLTKIQVSALRALEENKPQKIINKTYLKGFLRQYAKALQLNEADIVRQYEKEMAAEEEAFKPAPVSKLDSSEIHDKRNVLWFRTPTKVITIAAVVIIFILVNAIYFFSMKLVSYSQETFKDPQTKVSVEPTTKTPQLDNIISNEQENTLALPTGTASDDSLAKPATTIPSEETKPKIVSVEASEKVTVEAVWSTGKKETIQLRPNSRHVFYYAKKIKLVVSDGAGVTVNANDKDLGKPGESGVPVTLNFD